MKKNLIALFAIVLLFVSTAIPVMASNSHEQEYILVEENGKTTQFVSLDDLENYITKQSSQKATISPRYTPCVNGAGRHMASKTFVRADNIYIGGRLWATYYSYRCNYCGAVEILSKKFW